MQNYFHTFNWLETTLSYAHWRIGAEITLALSPKCFKEWYGWYNYLGCSQVSQLTCDFAEWFGAPANLGWYTLLKLLRRKPHPWPLKTWGSKPRRLLCKSRLCIQVPTRTQMRTIWQSPRSRGCLALAPHIRHQPQRFGKMRWVGYICLMKILCMAALTTFAWGKLS